MRKLSMDELGRKSVAEFKQAEKNKIIVVLDNIRSMHNVGSVFRTADACVWKYTYMYLQSLTWSEVSLLCVVKAFYYY